MGERELREKYGGKLPKAINRAIRAECEGGNEALDTLTNLAAAAKQSHWHDKQGRPTPEAEAYYKHQKNVVGRMDAQVRRTWQIPADAGADSPGARKTTPAGNSKRPRVPRGPRRASQGKGAGNSRRT